MGYNASMIEVLPQSFWLLVFATFGLIVGSFLNVVIYRLHTGKSLSGHSHCLSCQSPLRWYELMPVLSYVLLAGRCSHCGSLISRRYFWVELLTAFMFVLVYLQSLDWLETTFLLLLVSVLIVGVVYDLYHKIIPDEISALVGLLGFGWVGFKYYADWPTLFLTIGTALLVSAAMAGLWQLSGGRLIGLGDAKLVFGLVLFAGLAGTFSFLVLSFWAGAVISILVILFLLLKQRLLNGEASHKSLRARMKTEVPFAPFMAVGFVLAFFWQVDVLVLSAYISAYALSVI